MQRAEGRALKQIVVRREAKSKLNPILSFFLLLFSLLGKIKTLVGL